MRERFFRFMQGRYGVDAFGRFLIYTDLILAVLSMLFRNSVLFFPVVFLLVYSYYRIFSRNIYKRTFENNKFLDIKAAFSQKAGCFLRKFSGGKRFTENGRGEYSSKFNSYSGNCYEISYKVFKCPKCAQKLRVPKGKGRIMITCRRCGTEFRKRS